MVIKLTAKEQDNLIINDIGTRKLSEQYIADRDKFWDGIVQKGRKKGKDFWNGVLYCFESLEQTNFENPVIFLGEMTYSDRMFKKNFSDGELVKRYGQDHLFAHCGVSINIVTSDQRFVVGVKKMTTNLEENRLGHVSGNLNKDEVKVSNMEDLYSSAIHELEEETSVEVDRKLLQFNQINFFSNYFNFDFVYKAEFSSKDVDTVFKDQEFLDFEALTLEEILNEKRVGITDFEYSKRYLGDLLK